MIAKTINNKDILYIMPFDRTKIYDGNLYYVGDPTMTTTSGNVSIKYAGKWNGTMTTSGWSVLDGGVATGGYARGIVVVSATEIYIFGVFTSIGTAIPCSCSNIARWDGTKWNNMGTGATNGAIRDIAIDSVNNVIYVVGEFTIINGVSANRVAKYSGGVWSALQSGANSHVYSCTLDSDKNLYVCGSFSGVTNSSFLSSTSGIARWNRTTNLWQSLYTTGSSNTGWKVIYGEDTNCVYYGGSFSSVNGVANTKILAKYNVATSTWSSLGAFNSGSDSTIYDIEYVKNGELYIGGYFVSNGNDVARLYNNVWYNLGLTGGHTFVPTQTSVGAIEIASDDNGNVFLTRNAGGFYILKSGETVWRRLDNLTSNITIGKNPGYVVPATPTTSINTVVQRFNKISTMIRTNRYNRRNNPYERINKFRA